MIFIGDSGTGKTHLATALAVCAATTAVCAATTAATSASPRSPASPTSSRAPRGLAKRLAKSMKGRECHVLEERGRVVLRSVSPE